MTEPTGPEPTGGVPIAGVPTVLEPNALEPTEDVPTVFEPTADVSTVDVPTGPEPTAVEPTAAELQGSVPTAEVPMEGVSPGGAPPGTVPTGVEPVAEPTRHGAVRFDGASLRDTMSPPGECDAAGLSSISLAQEDSSSRGASKPLPQDAADVSDVRSPQTKDDHTRVPKGEDTDSDSNVRYVLSGQPTGWAAMAAHMREYDEEKVKNTKEDIDTLLTFVSTLLLVLLSCYLTVGS